MVKKSFVPFLSVVILVLSFITVCLINTPTGFAAGSGIGGKPGFVDDGRRLNIGVEIFTVAPGIITLEKRKSGKIDNSGVSNTGIQKQLNAGNSRTATQNSQKIEKRKIKVPSSKASKVLRDTESAYLAVRLKQLLEDKGKYGMVHVIPASKGNGNNVVFSSTAFDYVIRTEILKSDGYRVAFRVRYYSSVNGFKEPVVKKTLSTTIPESAYVGKEDAATGVEELEKDPYNLVLERIVSVLNEKVKDEQIMYSVKRHQELTLAWYGHEVLPVAFKDYRITRKREGYVVDPAPNPANPFVRDVNNWHKDELMNIDAFEGHYKKAANDVEGPYLLWRRDTRKALIAYMDLKDEIKKAKNKAMIQMVIIIAKRMPVRYGTDSKTIGLILIKEIIKLLTESTIEKDGRITVPNLRTLLGNNDLGEVADRLEDYNEQLAVQAVAVESLKEEFTTLSKPVTLMVGTKSQTYYGKLDVAFRQFKEDLRKEYSEETVPADTDRDINNKSGKTADKDDDKDKNIGELRWSRIKRFFKDKLVKTADKDEDDDEDDDDGGEGDGWDEL